LVPREKFLGDLPLSLPSLKEAVAGTISASSNSMAPKSFIVLDTSGA